VTCDGLVSRRGGVETLLAASCYRNRDKLRFGSCEPVGSKASFICTNTLTVLSSLVTRENNREKREIEEIKKTKQKRNKKIVIEK